MPASAKAPATTSIFCLPLLLVSDECALGAVRPLTEHESGRPSWESIAFRDKGNQTFC
jgi:hypothetical protein